MCGVIANAAKQQSVQAAERAKASETGSGSSSGSCSDESSLSSSEDVAESESNLASMSEDSEDELRRSSLRFLSHHAPPANVKLLQLVDRIISEFERFKSTIS